MISALPINTVPLDFLDPDGGVAIVQTKELIRVRRLHLVMVLALSLALTATPELMLATDATASAPTSTAPANGALIEFWNCEIAILRGTIAGVTPQERAEWVVPRLGELPVNVRATDIVPVPFEVEGQDGVGFTYNGGVLFFLGTSDLDNSGTHHCGANEKKPMTAPPSTSSAGLTLY